MDSSTSSASPRGFTSRRAPFALFCCAVFASFGCGGSSLNVMTVGSGEITVTCDYGTLNTECFEGSTSGTFVQAYYKLDGLPGNTCIVAAPVEGGPVYWGDDCACDSSPGAGDCVGDNQCLVIGEIGKRTCSVSFCSSPVSLSVEAFGPGQVYDRYDPSSLRFFACGPDESCTRPFCADEGEVVRLQAQPRTSSGAIFLGWEGDCDENGFVTMDADRQCTARFEQPQLTVTVSGSGTVTSPPGIESCRVGDPDSNCWRLLAAGTSVALNALPDPGATFIGWGSDCSGTDPSVSLEVSGSLSCTAEFSVVLGEAGVVDLLTVDVDGSLLPEGTGYDTSALDASSDLGVVSFDDPSGRGLVRDRRSSPASGSRSTTRRAGSTRPERATDRRSAETAATSPMPPKSRGSGATPIRIWERSSASRSTTAAPVLRRSRRVRRARQG